MAERLTEGTVKALRASASGTRIFYDSEVRGFGCRVTAAGAKAFVLNYRNSSGRERRFTIGRHPDWPVATARAEAKRLKLELRANGSDPLAQMQDDRTAPTMADLAERYLEEHASKKRPSTQVDAERIFRTFVLPAFAHKRVAEITYADCEGLHRKITKRGTKHRANRVIALLSKAFNLSIRWKWRIDNPCRGIERNPEGKRVRYLKSDELVRLTAALAEYEDQDIANIVRLLLLTGARRGEVLGAKWADFDLEEGVWTKPGATTKQQTEHIVPLSAPAMKLLTTIRAGAGDDVEFVFPGGKDGHRGDLKKPWPKICKAARLTGVRVHDLRHTYASLLASAGFSLPMIGALLGHTQPQTTARYAHLFDNPLRKATDRVGAIIAGGRPAKVMRMRRP